MSVAAKIYSVRVPAGGSARLLAVGSSFKILAATSAIVVKSETFGEVGELVAGQGARLKQGEFSALEFRDRSGSVNNLQVLVAGDEFTDDRVQGEVSVVDGAIARTLASQAFIASINCLRVPAQLSVVQLFNPAASGKRVIVQSMTIGVYGGSSAVGFGFNAVASGTLIGYAVGKQTVSPVTSSAAQTRTLNGFDAGGGGVLIGILGQWGVITLQADQTLDYVLTEPLSIEPGFGLGIWAGTTNVDLWTTVQFREETIS